MKLSLRTLTYLVVLIFCSKSYATIVTFETRTLDNGVDASDFSGSWASQGSAIELHSFTDFTMLRSGDPTMTHIHIDLTLDRENVNWQFIFGIDAGLGAGVYLDDNLLYSRGDDIWWLRDWQHEDVFNVNFTNLGRSNQTIDIYWAEVCCDGPSTIKFIANDNVEYALSAENLDAVSTPEPNSILLLFIGCLAANIYANRRSKQPAQLVGAR